MNRIVEPLMYGVPRDIGELKILPSGSAIS
jgi:hypothetical protein